MTIYQMQVLVGLVELLAEHERLAALTNEQLVEECLESEAADDLVVEEMMNRLSPGWDTPR